MSIRGFILIAALIALITACERSTPHSPPALADSSPRIVCLSPALTDLLINLQLTEFIVGRDAWDDQLDEHVPRVGDLFNLDYEAITALKPTHIILQTHPDHVPALLRDLARQRDVQIVAIHIDSLDDILKALRSLAEVFDEFLSENVEGPPLRSAEEIERRIESALSPLPTDVIQALGPILILHHVDPPSAFGPGSYLSQVLDQLGAPNALTSGGPWQELDLEALATMNPWAILLIGDASSSERDRANTFPALNLTAARDGRIVTLSHPQALLPCTSVVEVATRLRKILTQLAALSPESEPAQ